ncbi:MAG: glucan biosynthesis protein D [Proteobacteria bacterium]|nr:MAG: glucan biosynthesis protein D [Pseudomonadota bacterium]
MIPHAATVEARSPGRLRLFACFAAGLALALAPFAADAQARKPSKRKPAFDFEAVSKRAEKLARSPFKDPHGVDVPEWLLQISYDQWRDVRFKPEQSLWRRKDSSFEVQFFHAGLFYDRTVKVHEVDAQGVRDVPFNPNQFDYGKNEFASRVPQDMGFAGFRVHYPIKTAGYKDEVIVFLGASYFRAVGKEHAYGLSARGVAVDTALPSGEEFPFFKEFWLVRPAPTAKEMEIYALLDSPRLTGAYRFIVYPGDKTIVDVESRLFLRKKVGKLGIAPLTSMFYSGENNPSRNEDYRPEVHDSDGLLLFDSTSEWTWRPLKNPRQLTVNSFRMTNPRGFGLIQRDRDYEHYQDLETRMETRPSVWIEPKGDWGPGAVELVQIPTQADIHDNVVSYWLPDPMPEPMQPLDHAYRMTWYGDDPVLPPAGRVIATRRDRGTFEDGWRFVVDFAGKSLEVLPAETVLQGVVTVGGGELLEQQVVKNPVNGQWRLIFQVRPQGGNSVEMRAFLRHGEEALTETWSYVQEP